MSALHRRDLLATLLALTAAGGIPALACAAEPAGAFQDLDVAAVERIGRAWLAAHPDASAKSLGRRLFPGGRNAGTLTELRRRVTDDFRRGQVFIHRGWRLSDTEGALFGLLALGNTAGTGA